MTIPKEYNHKTYPPVLMKPWGHQIAAEIKARFGLDKPHTSAEVAAYVRAAAEVMQDHGSAALTFEWLHDQVGEAAYVQTAEDGYRVVINVAREKDGSIYQGEIIVGHGASASFCKALKALIDAAALQVFMPSRVMHFYPDNDAPKVDGLVVQVVKGPPPR